jgi:pSer/pThr/pTyr-binding forkhead associated (FHA) protein
MIQRDQRPREPYLVLEEAGRGRRFFALAKPLVKIGRANDNDIVLDDPRVSRLHAYVKRSTHRFMVEDASSRNGTFVNGVGVAPGDQRVLVSGDRLMVGGFYLSFQDPASTVVSDKNPGVVLEDRTGEVRVGGQSVALTPKEYVLLRMLMNQPGAVCARDEIAQVVWPEYEGQIADYNIDNLVARLRQKIERGPHASARIVFGEETRIQAAAWRIRPLTGLPR